MTQNLKFSFSSTTGNYGTGGSIIEEEDSSDEDEPLALTKKRITNEELRKKPTGAGGDGNDTAQLPSLQSSGISVDDADTPAKKRKVRIKADQLAKIAEREKKDKVLDRALSIIEGGGGSLTLRSGHHQPHLFCCTWAVAQCLANAEFPGNFLTCGSYSQLSVTTCHLFVPTCCAKRSTLSHR